MVDTNEIKWFAEKFEYFKDAEVPEGNEVLDQSGNPVMVSLAEKY